MHEMSANWKILMLLLVACVGLCSDVFLAKPKNVAVIAGQRMEMECRTGYESKVTAWYFQPSARRGLPLILVTNSGSKIHFGGNISSKFGVNFDANGSGMIYFNSTTTDNAGIYVCEAEKDLSVSKSSAQLIVFESEPICETDLRERSKLFTDENKITMRCKVSYRGDWLPTVEWRQHNSNGGWGDYVRGTPVANGHGLVETSFVNNVSVSSSLTVVANSTVDGSFFSFNVFFTSCNGSIRTNATNIPEFRFTWNSTTISIDSTTVIDASSTETTAKSGSTNHGLTSSGFVSVVAVLSGLLVLLTAVILPAVVWHYKRLKRRKSGNEPVIMNVATASEDQNQSEMQAKSTTTISPVLNTQNQKQSQQKYEILCLHGDDIHAYSELVPRTDLNSGSTESPAVNSNEDNSENAEHSANDCSSDGYEEVRVIDAADSTKAYLELKL